MITFQSRQKAIQSAEIIERKAHNIYPHISSSKLKKRYLKSHNISEYSPNTHLPDFYLNIRKSLKEFRAELRNSQSYFADLIYGLQDRKVGNCFEDACLAELIGKINGQDNIFVGNIFVNKGNFDGKKKIDHSVAFITNKNIKSGEEYTFKNKEALIIDPWLGITDFAGNYFTKLKHHYKKFFNNLPEQDFFEYIISSEAKNSKEFRDEQKACCNPFEFRIELAYDAKLSESKQSLYKSFFPELVIKKYEKIELPEITQQKSIEKKDSL